MTGFAVFQVLYCLIMPVVCLVLARRFAFFRAFGPVLLCYGVGILVGNTLTSYLIEDVSKTIGEAMIPLSIPLLLFGARFEQLRRYGKMLSLSFVMILLTVVFAAFVLGLAFDGRHEEMWKIAGMVTGTYTGGTANLMSVGVALEVKKETFVVVNASDQVVGGVYLMFLLTIAKPVLSRLFPLPELAEPYDVTQGEDEQETSSDILAQMWSDVKGNAKSGALAFLVAVVCFASVVGASFLFAGKIVALAVILGVTTLGIVCSLIPFVRRLEASEPLGNYFILVFCVSIGLLTDLVALFSSGGLILLYTALTVLIALVLHHVLALLLNFILSKMGRAQDRIDVDTFLVTSVAAIYGPAFIPLLLRAINNRSMLLPGLAISILGYAVGTYLGLLVAYALHP